jgi:DDE superfamily endonuclease
MEIINNNQLIAQLRSFRQHLRKLFKSYSDSIIDLIDALSGNSNGASSPVELSLSPLFERTYSSIYKAIEKSFGFNDNKKKKKKKLKSLTRLIAEVTPKPEKRPFYLFTTDITPHPRPHSPTLPERGYIYQPNTVASNKPVGVGHAFSFVSMLPEKDSQKSAPWSIPLSAERVPIEKSGISVGIEQINALMSDESLPWHGKLSVLTADSGYSKRSFLFDSSKHKNLVVITRVRSNRIFYFSPPTQQEEKKRGCPKKFGERFDLALEETWHPCDETTQLKSTTKKGRQFTVTLKAWNNMLMRGTQQEQMYKCPFTLVRVHVTDDTGCAVWKPMWLIVMGEQRGHITLAEVYSCYRQRFDIEHMFRFKKQRLLMTNFQTTEVKREENWIRLVMLAYVQLWAAKQLSIHLPRPWERYLQQNHDKIVSPSTVQRDFQRIISEVGKPGNSPKPRGNATGRVRGQTQTKRVKHPVIKKSQKSNIPQPKTA